MKITPEEDSLIAKYLNFYRDLESGKIEPSTAAQRRFIDVIKGLLPAENPHEIAFLKFTDRYTIYHTSTDHQKPGLEIKSSHSDSTELSLCLRCDEWMEPDYKNSICIDCIKKEIKNPLVEIKSYIHGSPKEKVKNLNAHSADDNFNTSDSEYGHLGYKFEEIESKNLPENQVHIFRKSESRDYISYGQKKIFKKVITNNFSLREAKVLITFGDWLSRLQLKTFEPDNYIERHFLAVCSSEEDPLYEFEKIWMDFTEEINYYEVASMALDGDIDWQRVIYAYLVLAGRGNQKSIEWVEKNSYSFYDYYSKDEQDAIMSGEKVDLTKKRSYKYMYGRDFKFYRG